MKDNANLVIHGQRVLLVPYRQEHVPQYHEWMQVGMHEQRWISGMCWEACPHHVLRMHVPVGFWQQGQLLCSAIALAPPAQLFAACH